ncbi:MAG: FtsX-like permease family protein, partial [Chloroflexota bacterium]
NGAGASITVTETGAQASQVSSYVIDPATYPFYDEIMTTDGQTLAEVLQVPTDVVIGQNVADQTDIQVGDVVQINGASESFTVRGIVSLEEGIRSPLDDLFAGIFGFYYLNQDAITLFEDVTITTNTVFFRIAPEVNVADFDRDLQAEFPFFSTTTTEDLRRDNEQIVDLIDQLTSVMGLISLLIGSIGIVNTMQVIVQRRMLEVAVLKTIGMQGEQITLLFLMEALLLGVIGSAIGIILGWGGTFLIKGAAEQIFVTTLSFRIAPEPAINGFVLGVIVATVFGFLPTISAAQIRPGIVIRPQDGLVPRAGWLQRIAVLVLIVLVISLIAQTILGGTFVTALLIVGGTFIAAGFIYAILWGIIWVIGRFFPSFGIVDLKVSLRQMLASKGRGASTLLALVVGVFSLSTITLFAESINNILEASLESAGGNLLINVQSFQQYDEVEALLEGFDGVNSYQASLGYTAELVSWEQSETGEVITPDTFPSYLASQEIAFPPFFDGTDEERLEIQADIIDSTFLNTSIEARSLDTVDADAPMELGRSLTADDATSNLIVFGNDPILVELGVQPGDIITYEVVQEGLFASNRETVTFEVAGIAAAEVISFNINSGTYAPAGIFPDTVNPTDITVIADVDDERVQAFRSELTQIQGTFVIETAIFTRLIESLIGTFTAFPTLVAALGLIVGGVVIANSVALATMERRNEIAVMKSVGLQRERVLGMLLLENGILGFIGGLFGVGIGVLVLLGFAATSDVPFGTIPWGTAFLLMMLCVGVAIIAAITSAWSASGEKPLTVLRYE